MEMSASCTPGGRPDAVEWPEAVLAALAAAISSGVRQVWAVRTPARQDVLVSDSVYPVLHEKVHEDPEGRLAGQPLSAPFVGGTTGQGAGAQLWLVIEPSTHVVAAPTTAYPSLHEMEQLCPGNKLLGQLL